MEKKPKTAYKEIRKKMKRLSINEKKQITKEKEMKDAKKKESNKQKITQRVKININIPTQKAGSTTQFPSSFSNIRDKEQLNLLASINERLQNAAGVLTKPKEPIPFVSSGNASSLLPTPKSIESSKPLIDFNEISNPIESSKPLIDFNEISNPIVSNPIINKPRDTSNFNFLDQLTQAISNRAKKETDINKIDTEIEAIKPEIKNTSPLKEELIQKVNEKKEKEMMGREDIRIPLTPPKDESNLSLIEQVTKPKKKEKKLIIEEDEDTILEENLKKEQEILNEKLKEEKKKVGGRRKLTDEEKRQREEEVQKQKEELKQQKELDKIQKAIEIERKKELEKAQKDIELNKMKENQKQLISDKAFNVLLSETPESEKGRIRRQYEVDDLSDSEIKIMLKQKYGYTTEQVKRIFSLK